MQKYLVDAINRLGMNSGTGTNLTMAKDKLSNVSMTPSKHGNFSKAVIIDENFKEETTS
jgi:hypothetical protein